MRIVPLALLAKQDIALLWVALVQSVKMVQPLGVVDYVRIVLQEMEIPIHFLEHVYHAHWDIVLP